MSDDEGRCPRCGGPIPSAEHEGEHSGALSRTARGPDDDPVEVCSACGSEEAREENRGELTPQSEWPVDRPSRREA